jgi:predicted phosphodiesterase
MSIAALYDIHGNLPALDAALRDVADAGATQIVVGGDVMPGPLHVESLRRLRSLDIPVHFIHGNGDREAIAHRSGGGTPTLPEPLRRLLRWTGEQLSNEEAAFVEAWPATVTLAINGIGDVLFCHATPRNDTDIFTAQTPDAPLIPLFANIDAALIVCGHTHMTFDRTIGGARVVNAGSVGMPLGEPGAHWLLLGPSVETRLTTYDTARAAECIRKSDYPQGADFAERHVLATPSAEAMLAAYAKMEVR